MRSVICHNPANGAQHSYPTARAAAKELGLDPVTLAHAAAGTHHMQLYGGYRFWYTQGVPRTSGRAIVLVRDGERLEFPSIKAAARSIAAARGSTVASAMSNLCQTLAKRDPRGEPRFTAYGYVVEQIGHTHNPTMAGKTHTDATRARMAQAKQAKMRAVVATDARGHDYCFASITDAARHFNPGVHRPSLGNIVKVLNGTQQHAWGLSWRYA